MDEALSAKETDILSPLRLAALAVLAVAISSALWAQQNSSPPARQTADVVGPASHILAPPANRQWPVGQSYVYEVEWRLWTAGTATLGMSQAGDPLRVNATADAAGFVALLYPVHDRFQALFNPRSFCSQSVTKHTEEGFHKRETSISFDYLRRKSVLNEKNLKSGETKHTEQDIPGCVTDVLSGIYYVGSLPLLPGASYQFPLNDGGKTVDVTARVETRETVKTPAGTFPTIRVSPEGSAGVVKERGRVWVWYSDDARRIPVQMRARMFWGTLTFHLLRVESK